MMSENGICVCYTETQKGRKTHVKTRLNHNTRKQLCTTRQNNYKATPCDLVRYYVLN